MRLVLPLLGLLAGGLLMIGAVLDWSGVDYSSALDRGLAFAAGILLVVLAIVAWLRWPRALAFALAAAAVSLNMGIVNYRDIDGKLYEYEDYQDASVGIGIYLVLVGGALALLIGLAALLPRRWLGRAERSLLDS